MPRNSMSGKFPMSFARPSAMMDTQLKTQSESMPIIEMSSSKNENTVLETVRQYFPETWLWSVFISE